MAPHRPFMLRITGTNRKIFAGLGKFCASVNSNRQILPTFAPLLDVLINHYWFIFIAIAQIHKAAIDGTPIASFSGRKSHRI
jgi:hypothetical protein